MISNDVVKANKGCVLRTAWKLSRGGANYDDLVQEGWLAVLDVSRRWSTTDEGYGRYMHTAVYHKMCAHLRGLDSVPPVERKELRALAEARRAAEQANSGPVPGAVVAREAGFAPDRYRFLLHLAWWTERVADGEVHESHLTPSRGLSDRHDMDAVVSAMLKLKPQGRRVLELKHFEEVSVVGIAKIMGVSTQRIQQIHNETIVRLKELLVRTTDLSS